MVLTILHSTTVITRPRTLPKLNHHREGQLEGRQSVHIPLPLDHFFFCFFPPVAAGAILTDLLVLRWRVVVEMWVDGR